jgi:Tol biopolymer transport system component
LPAALENGREKLDASRAARLCPSRPKENLRRFTLVFAFALAVFVLPASAAPPGPASNGRIVFTAGTTDLWTVKPDGSDVQLLASLPQSPDYTAFLRDASYSADGSRLAFIYEQVGTNTLCGAQFAICWSIVVMNGDSTGRRIVLSSEDIASGALALSPNGRTIAFTRVIVDREPIFLIDDDGRHLRQLTEPAQFGTDVSPTWSPDGHRIAFQSNRDCCAQGSWSLYIANVHNRRLRKVMAAGGNDIEPDWSPDGDRLVFTRTFGYPDYRIYAVNVDGTREREVFGDSGAETPKWSPDGERILYSNLTGLAIVDADGTDPQFVTSGAILGYDWEPSP